MRPAATLLWRRARCATSAITSPSSSPRPSVRRAMLPRRSSVDYRPLPAVVVTADAMNRRPVVHDISPDNSVYVGRSATPSRDERGFRESRARHQDRSRQQPSDPKSDGAPRRRRRIRSRQRSLHALQHDEPEPACRASRPLGIHRHRARTQAPRHRARRRRRFRLQDLHLRGGDGLRLGGEESRPSGEMDVGPHGGLPGGRPRARPRDPCRDGARRQGPDPRRCACTRPPISAPICPPSRRPFRPISTRRSCRANMRSRDLLRSRRGLHEHRAGRRLSRRRTARSHIRGRAPRRSRGARDGQRSGRSAQEFRQKLPAPDAGHHVLRRRQLHRLSRKGAGNGRLKGFGKRKRESARHGKLRGIGTPPISRPAASPRPAVGSLGAGVGLWETAEVRVNPIGTVEILTGSHSHGQGHETTFAQLVSERLGIPIDNVSIVHGDTDKVQMGMGTYGSRSGAVGMSAIVKALDKIEAKAKKVAGHCSKPRTATSSSRTESSPSGHRQGDRFRLRRAAGLHRPQIQRAGSRARPEGKRLLGPDQFHLPGGRPHLRSRDRPRDRRHRGRQMDGGRRFRRRHQSDDRRGTGPRRHRPGHRPGAARRRGLRRRRAIGDGEYMDYSMPSAEDLPTYKVGT